jgi:hypothetical protein
MPARRVRCLVASVVAVGAVALLPAAASAHPEACANTTAIASAPTGDWFADWSASEGCLPDAVVRNFDDSDAQLTSSDDAEGTDNLDLVFNQPKAPPFETEGDLNSDLAFEDGYAYQGNYDGFLIWDVRKPQRPRLVSQVHCPGSQNDVTINDGILVTSTDSVRNKAECEGNTTVLSSSPEYGQPTNWEGLRVFDVSDPRNPQYVTAVRTDCGSHTHTVLPERDRLIIYVQSYDLGARKYRCDAATDPHDKISIVEVPRDNPAAARVVNDPVLFPDGGYNNPNGSPPGRNTTGCHDITVYQELDLAAGACVSEGILLDISDPVNPEVISTVTNPTFAFWHSATISDDGDQVLFTDELGGGSQPTCNADNGPTRGADAIYDITDRANPRFLSYFKIPRHQTNEENCVAHNGNLIPNMQGRDILVQSWYQGGLSVVDWTDGANPREIAWFDRGPFNETRRVLGGLWSTYFYNGYIFGSEIQRGFDVFKLDGFGRGFKSDTLNPQTQFSFGKPGRGNAKKN